MTPAKWLVRVAPVTTISWLVAACGSTPAEAPSGMETSQSVVASVEKWRAKHEADYRREFVTIAGLHMLKPGASTAGSAPGSDIELPSSTPATLGRFVLEEERVLFEPAPGAPVTLRDQPVSTPIFLKDDSTSAVDELVVGNVRLVVHVSGTDRMIRVRDPDGPLAKRFLGFSWFPIDLEYRIVGRFVRDAAPRRIKVINTFGDLDEYSTEGSVEFSLFGEALRLRPFTTRAKRLYFVFKDASSGKETYEAARFLYADLAHDGSVVLDFNEAYNPPCAFNPYTTCPLPLPENQLPVRILAGEKAY